MQLDHNGMPIATLFANYKRFFSYTRPDFPRILLNLGLHCLIVVVGAAMIWMVGRGFDALHDERFVAIPAYLAVFTVLVLLLQLLRYSSQYLYEWMQQRIIYAIRRALYVHLLKLSTPFRSVYPKGDLLTRLGQDIVQISELLVIVPGHLFSYGLTCLIYIAVLFYIDVTLALIALALAPLLWFQQRLFTRPTRLTSRNFLAWQGRMGAFEEETLGNLEGIASFTAETSMLSRFDERFTRFRRAAMRNLLLNNAFVVSFELLIVLFAVVLVTLGVYRIQQGQITIGDLVNFLLYIGYLAPPLRGLANIPIESQIRAGAAERVAELFDREPSIPERSDAISLRNVRGDIQFRHVKFAYANGATVLNDFNLAISAREFIAIVGPSGVGKSTLIRLLQRFYDPQLGEITLDGVDIRGLKLDWLRKQIAVVSQEPFIIDETVYANMRLVRQEASEQDVIDVLRAAYAHDFVQALPQGIHTRLENYGATLSSGQRQRLSIAQALLKNAPIIILDEATSALDSHSEQAVTKAIHALRKRCTVIIIAHRLATIVDADRIVYLSGDGIAITGTHDELINKNIAYRQAVQFQQVDPAKRVNKP